MRVAGGEHGDRLALAQLGRHRLGHREVHVGRNIDPLQGGELGAFVQVLAGMDIGETHPRRERGADRLACDDGPGARDLRQRDLARRASLVHLLLRRGLRLPQALQPCEGRCRQVGLGGLGVELRLLDRDVQRHQDRASFDYLPGRQRHLADRARELVAQGDRREREDGSDRCRRRAILALPGDGQGH